MQQYQFQMDLYLRGVNGSCYCEQVYVLQKRVRRKGEGTKTNKNPKDTKNDDKNEIERKEEKERERE